MERRDGKIRAILLGAGYGERLRPITDITPKILVDVAGAPLLWHWALELRRANVTDVLVNTHHLSEIVRLALKRLNLSSPPSWHETYEPDLLGSAGTIRANIPWLLEADICLIVYGDNFPPSDLEEFVAHHKHGNLPATISLSRAVDPSRCGVATVDENMLVTSFEEKPKTPVGNLVFSGLIALDTLILHEISFMSAHDIASEVFPKLIGRMQGWYTTNAWFDIGTHTGLAAARKYAEERSFNV